MMNICGCCSKRCKPNQADSKQTENVFVQPEMKRFIDSSTMLDLIFEVI